MKLTITIDMDNAAFDQPDVEIARILTEYVGRLWSGTMAGKLRDANGNVVGEARLTD